MSSSRTICTVELGRTYGMKVPKPWHVFVSFYGCSFSFGEYRTKAEGMRDYRAMRDELSGTEFSSSVGLALQKAWFMAQQGEGKA